MHILLVDFFEKNTLREHLWFFLCIFIGGLGFKDFLFLPRTLRKWCNLTTYAYFSVGWVVEPPRRWYTSCQFTPQEPLRLLEAASGQISKVHRERHGLWWFLQRLRHILIDFCIMMILYIMYIYYLKLNYNHVSLFFQSAKSKATFAVNEQNLVSASWLL